MRHDSDIPFNKPRLAGKEMQYLAEAAQSGHLAGDGAFTTRCHTLLESILGVRKVLLTTSCTHALEMAALLLNIQVGDEVIVPAYTFVSVANAFVLRGARPIFADIRADTLNLDERAVERLITSRTKAIVAVHYAGVGCDMDVLLDLVSEPKIPLVEDNAHGPFGTYRGRSLGSMGALGTLSFHETKNLTCGEGGALLINDPSLIARAEIIREKGTNRSRFLRGQVDKYSWIDVGSSYLPTELVAAVLLAQLEQRDQVQADRRRIWDAYATGLREWAPSRGITLPTVPDDCQHTFHTFYMLVASLADREALIAYLRRHRIASAFHYLPLHLSEMGRSFGGRPGDCPVTESVSDRLLRLPLYRELGDADVARILDVLRAW